MVNESKGPVDFYFFFFLFFSPRVLLFPFLLSSDQRAREARRPRGGLVLLGFTAKLRRLMRRSGIEDAVSLKKTSAVIDEVWGERRWRLGSWGSDAGLLWCDSARSRMHGQRRRCWWFRPEIQGGAVQRERWIGFTDDDSCLGTQRQRIGWALRIGSGRVGEMPAVMVS